MKQITGTVAISPKREARVPMFYDSVDNRGSLGWGERDWPGTDVRGSDTGMPPATRRAGENEA